MLFIEHIHVNAHVLFDLLNESHFWRINSYNFVIMNTVFLWTSYVVTFRIICYNCMGVSFFQRGLQQNVSTLADDEITVENSWKKTSKIPIMQV